jgi:hypothetical protein
LYLDAGAFLDLGLELLVEGLDGFVVVEGVAVAEEEDGLFGAGEAADEGA